MGKMKIPNRHLDPYEMGFGLNPGLSAQKAEDNERSAASIRLVFLGSYGTRTMQHLSLRIKTFELDPSVRSCKLPDNLSRSVVSVFSRCSHLRLHSCYVGNPAIKAPVHGLLRSIVCKIHPCMPPDGQDHTACNRLQEYPPGELQRPHSLREGFSSIC